ncbi:MAG: EAL domain-containing protein [Nitrospirota bacterium]
MKSAPLLRILLIEDNPADADLIREMTESCRPRCLLTIAEELSSGLELLEKKPFDVVLLDLGLPDSSGLDTLRSFQEKASELPVIVLTGLADEELAAQAISMGAQDYLVKGQLDSETFLRSSRYAQERKRAELAQYESGRRFRQLADVMPQLVWTADPDGTVDYYNKRVTEFEGFEQGPDGSWHWAPVLHPDDRELTVKAWQHAVKTGERYDVEHRVKRRDGAYHWYLSRGEPVRDSAGRIVKWYGTATDINDLKQTQEALRESEERYRMLFTNMTEGFALGHVEYAGDGSPKDFRFIEINTAFERITGLTRGILGRPISSVLPDLEKSWIETYGRVARTGESVRFENYNKDTNRHYDVYAYSPGKDRFAIIFTDITERKRTEEALRAAQETSDRRLAQLNAVVTHMTEGLVVFDPEGNLLDMNPAALQIHGFKSVETLRRHLDDLTEIFELFDLEGRPLPVEQWPIGRVLKGEVIESYEVRVRRRDTGVTWIASYGGAPVKDPSGRLVLSIVTLRDITERKRLEEEIRHMAHHDALTGLPNRRLFMDIVALELAEARRRHKKLSVLFLDLDRFKEVNDTLGHETGDELLVEVARRLKASIRESDTVARIGGDEFNIILTDVPRAEYAATVAQKILHSFKEPYFIAGHALHITTSIGISICPDDSEDADTLFRYADIAMYHAKELGKDNYQFYNAEINSRSVEKIRFESYLRRTIERGELSVYYQPQVDIRTGRIVCAEALVRWRHPELGVLPSRRFIPAAEETGFVTAIDEWVLRTACAQLKVWHEAGYPPVCVTVNLSAREFRNPQLAATIGRILGETGLSPDCLDIEITESMAMRDIDHTARQLNELTAIGVHISIDDFGTGYSSLSYLKRLPIQRLKIDRSFVKDVTTDPDNRAIIQAVTAMAHTMQMTVVAEGVETEEQLRFLHESRCDEAQGYLFNKPLPPERFTEVMTAGS